jgi:hypothetical protein
MPLNIINLLNEAERYKLYVLSCSTERLVQTLKEIEDENIPVLDVGKELAMSLMDKSKFLDIIAYENFVALIDKRAIKISSLQNRILAIHNLGILMEPYLSLNGSKILKELSKNIHIILIWEDQIDPAGKLHWGDRTEKYYFDFTDINLKKLPLL